MLVIELFDVWRIDFMGPFPKSFDNEYVMQSYPPRALDRRLREDWARDAREDPRVLMSLRIDFGPMG